MARADMSPRAVTARLARTAQLRRLSLALGSAGRGKRDEVGGRYARYVLVVLTIVYVFNFVDRQIISILAEEIKADIGVTDAQIGFLYGTAFAVFYAVFGIPLGRLADVWVRKNLIAIGLAFWSAMTALSGTARSFMVLGTYRIGVGVGEASASPAAFSMLSDYFPPRLRATVLSVYSSGVYIGAGVGLFIGGWVVEGWNAAFAERNAPLGLRGWQAAYFAVGIPGILMALWVWALREPRRGQSEGLVSADAHPHPFRAFGRELAAVLPPFTLLSLALTGAGGRRIAANLAAAGLIALAAFGLIQAVGNVPQWVALGIGVYAAFSWAQALALRDPPTFAMIFGSPALLLTCFGFASIAFVGYGIGFWAPPFFIRVHGVSPGQVGTALGLAAAAGGWLGVTLGGVLSDRLKAITPNARLWLGGLTIAATTPMAVWLLTTPHLRLAYVVNFGVNVVAALWLGSAATAVNELVLPRMRAIASAFYLLVVTFVGLALGPYTIGALSDALAAAGRPPQDALRSAMLAALGMFAVAGTVLAIAGRFLPTEERERMARARAAGEPGP
jgi:MFS family permease